MTSLHAVLRVNAALAFFLTLCAAKPSSDIKLIAHTKGDQSTFHIGEIIPLELSYSSTAPNTYQLDMATYDRSGRLAEEFFQVDPASGWDDPLHLYFESFLAFMGGGLRSSQILTPQPTVIRRELNEWVRFNQPGRYRLIVASGRASRVGAVIGDPPLTVSSNELWLDIIPATPEWQQQILEKARAALREHKTESAQAEAVKILRYLGTPAAAAEMARHLNDEHSAYEYMLGLASTPARESALTALHQLLSDPDFPITGLFLETMSLVALPAETIANRPNRRAELEDKFRQDLLSVLANKQGKALAISAYSIIDEAAMHSHDLPEEQKQKLTNQLIAGFESLPPQAQAELFQSRWKVLDHETMLPLLRKIAERYHDFPQPREINAYQFNEASAAALERWWELDPEGARPAIIQEILRPKPRFDAHVLGRLPEKELPEVDQQLADHLFEENASTEHVASLIARYATPAIATQVAGYLDERIGKLACAIQNPLLAYVLKVDRDAAIPRIEKAMAARGPGFSACNHTLFQDLAELHNDAALEDFALRALDDEDPQIVATAATYLGNYGSASAEEALWSHLASWSRRWKGREAELRYIPGRNLDTVLQEGAGSNMITALATAKAWLVDETKLNRLIELSVGPDQRRQAEQYLQTWNTRPRQIQFIGSDKPQFDIAQYHATSLQAATEKLEQFPRGSTFVWTGNLAQDGEQKAFQELSKAAGSRGIVITRIPEDPP